MEEFEIETAKEKRKKKKMIMTLLLVLVAVAVIGTSFALWQLTFTQTGTNVITTGCLNLTLTDNTDAITLADATPTTDDEGRGLTPYTFTLTNTCNVNTRYVINLETVSSGAKILADQYVKANLVKGTEEVFIDTLTESNQNQEKVIEEASAAYRLTEGMLAGNESVEFSLRLWMDEDTGPLEEVMNAEFAGKITITASYVPTATLASSIKAITADYTDEIWANKANIKTVIFQNTITDIEGATSFDISSNNSSSIMARLVTNTTDTTKFTVYIQADGNIIANSDSSNLFNGFTSLTEIQGLEYLDLSKVTNTSNMFNGCSNLTATLNLTNPNITTYDGMFTNAATAEGSAITINYTTETSSLVDAIVAATANPNITKGTETQTTTE